MNFLIIFSIQLLLMTIGYFITILIGVKNKIEAIGLSYLLGSGLITILFLLNHYLFDISLGALNFLLSVGISSIALISLIIFYKKQNFLSFPKLSKIKKGIKKFTYLEKSILSFLFLALSYTLFENYIWPITDWDSLALYDFRAKVIAANGNMLEGIELGYFFQYPPYTSFLHVFGYIFGINQIRIVYSFVYFSLITVFYSLLKRTKKNWVALSGALMLSVDAYIFRHAVMAYTNLSYVAFLSLGFIYLGIWLSSSKKRELILGGILVALSTWVRASDPFWYIGILIIIVGTIKNKQHLKHSIGLIAISMGIYKFWNVFVKSINPTSLGTLNRETKYIKILFENSSNYSNILKSMPEIFLYFWQNILATIGYLSPVLLFTIYYDLKKKNKLNQHLYLFLILILSLILIGIIIFSLFFETWNQIGGSLQRLSMVLIPIVLFVVFNSSIWEKDVIKK